MSAPLALAWIFLPPTGTIVLSKVVRAPAAMILWLFLFVPFVAEITVLTLEVGWSLTFDSLAILIPVYVGALLVFSYPAPLFGTLSWFFLKRMHLAERLPTKVFYISTVMIAAALGALFMLSLMLAFGGHEQPDTLSQLRILGVVGATAGSVTGFIVAFFSPGSRRAAAQATMGFDRSRW